MNASIVQVVTDPQCPRRPEVCLGPRRFDRSYMATPHPQKAVLALDLWPWGPSYDKNTKGELRSRSTFTPETETRQAKNSVVTKSEHGRSVARNGAAPELFQAYLRSAKE